MAVIADQDYRQLRVDIAAAGYYSILPANPRRLYFSVYNPGGAPFELVLSPLISAYVHAWQIVPMGGVLEVYRLRHGALTGLEIFAHSNGTATFAVIVELTETSTRNPATAAAAQARCRDPRTGAIITRGTNGRE